GGAYLVYIGIASLRAKKQLSKDANMINQLAEDNISQAKAFGRGFLTNTLNAKAAFFTISFFTVLVSPTTPIYMQLIYGAFIQLSTVTWFSIVAIFLTNSRVQSRFLGIKHWIERICGALLITLGIKLAITDIALPTH
ncbi:MAG TPA: LysE family transporter, partial [Myxococcota bacterium]|nr:LysE family transporter [Myxococcota bacterium]